MYEGPIKAADYASAGESPVMRQLRWTELVARIAATRDIRQALSDEGKPAQASFAAFHCNPVQESHQGVNHDVLSHGKITRLSRGQAASDAAPGDRETE